VLTDGGLAKGKGKERLGWRLAVINCTRGHDWLLVAGLYCTPEIVQSPGAPSRVLSGINLLLYFVWLSLGIYIHKLEPPLLALVV
jgi:hypothetical protein